MRSEGHVVDFRHRGYLAHFGDAAHVADVGLNDVNGAFTKQIEIKMTCEKSFAGGNRNSERSDRTPYFQ